MPLLRTGPKQEDSPTLIMSDFLMPEPIKQHARLATVSDTTLAIPALVPCLFQNVRGLSSSISSLSAYYPEPHLSEVHKEAGGFNAGNMACLRNSFASQQVSTQASELATLLSSWHSKPTVVTTQNGLVGMSK